MDVLYSLCIYEGLDAEENPCSHFSFTFDVDAVRTSFLSQWEKAKRLVRLRDEAMESADDVVLIPGMELNFQQKVSSSEDTFMELCVSLVNGLPSCRMRVKSDRSTSSYLNIGGLRTSDPTSFADQLMELLTTLDVMDS